jgi:predicted Rossmann fold nucleotide-binding protein DprA/Smf involved in DNA uptake
MEPDASLPWLALTLTPGVAARLTARLLREFGSPENVFRATLPALEACNLPAPAAQAIYKRQTFWRGKRGRRHTPDRLPHPELYRAGISSIAAPDL